jgi:hypothetical protein
LDWCTIDTNVLNELLMHMKCNIQEMDYASYS